MKRASGYIICVIHALLSVFCLSAQTTDEGHPGHDALLNRYELTCRSCLELKTAVSSGAQVSRKEASELLDSLVILNSIINASSEVLSPVQLTRFEAISKWFSTGNRPLVLDHKVLVRVLEKTSFAVTEDNSRIRVEHDSPESYEAADNNSRRKIRTYLLATSSVPRSSYGAMVGIQYGKWGGYARFSSNFRTYDYAYTCLGNGTLEDGGSIWAGGNQVRSELNAGIGALYGPTDWLAIYAGAGYGKSELHWDDIDGNWVKVKDLSFIGPSLEAGLLASWKFLTIGAGISTISFSTVSLDICLGFTF